MVQFQEHDHSTCDHHNEACALAQLSPEKLCVNGSGGNWEGHSGSQKAIRGTASSEWVPRSRLSAARFLMGKLPGPLDNSSAGFRPREYGAG